MASGGVCTWKADPEELEILDCLSRQTVCRGCNHEAGRSPGCAPGRSSQPLLSRDNRAQSKNHNSTVALAHSGFDQSYVSEEQAERAVAVQRMLAEPLAATPGDKFRYSNSNIQLAAAIVEIASGVPYDTFGQRNLWQPAGLLATGLAGDESADSATPVAGALPVRLQRRYWGEQGVYSSAHDLLRWYSALARGKILHPATMAEMFKPVVKMREVYATEGWFRGTTAHGNDFLFVRGNKDFRANALLYVYPKQRVVIIVVTHEDSRLIGSGIE
jgi:CubicO group peptidase (beta-lactamase class C family)